MTDAESFADRYVAVWNEPDPEERRARIAAMWIEDGVHPTEVLHGGDPFLVRVIERDCSELSQFIVPFQ